jgi:dihydrodipicolinate synthase/N-acetylneuraminate lyase
MEAHITAVISATDLPVMLYNNPPAYKTDFTPNHVAELAREYPTLVAIKESSADVRRIHAIRALIDNRLELLMGVDDLIVEGINVGVTGWIAGRQFFPHESVALFDQALAVANWRRGQSQTRRLVSFGSYHYSASMSSPNLYNSSNSAKKWSGWAVVACAPLASSSVAMSSPKPTPSLPMPSLPVPPYKSL